MTAIHSIQLLSFPGCPHAPEARANLEAALRRTGRGMSWEELDLTDPSVADRLPGYGSPTVLVDGRDVTGRPPGGSEGMACRVDGAPTVARILAALSSDEAPAGGGEDSR